MVLPLCRDLELDVVEPIARRAADGVDDELIAGAAGDLDAARERLEPQRAARRHRQRAVDGFGFARAAVAVIVPVAIALGAGRGRQGQGGSRANVVVIGDSCRTSQ